MIAALNATSLGEKENDVVQDVIAKGNRYYAKNKKVVTITMPVKNRNGDPMAALRISLKSFIGQTQTNAYARAIPIVEHLQFRVLYLKDFYR